MDSLIEGIQLHHSNVPNECPIDALKMFKNGTFIWILLTVEGTYRKAMGAQTTYTKVTYEEFTTALAASKLGANPVKVVNSMRELGIS